MKCFKRNQCKGKPMVCPQKGSMIIKASVFLLATLLILSISTVVIAQTKGVPQSPLTTLEEDRILDMHKRMVINNRPMDLVKAFSEELEHYMKDGCKKALAGDWLWDTWGDIVTITYNEQYKVFLGNVIRPIKMDLKPGHLLFKVDFFTFKGGTWSAPNNMDITWLRQVKQCREWVFEGTEYSFEERTKKKTETPLWLLLKGDQIEYKVEKDAYYLKRIK